MLFPKTCLTLLAFGLGVSGMTIERRQQVPFQPRVPQAQDDTTLFASITSESGITYERITDEKFPGYAIRLKRPQLCDNTVTSYSGYLDIDDENHLFFWAFESRGKPEKDPLVLWLNGGPGCSSSTGLLFENGPCRVTEKGLNTTFNPYGWNEAATTIFLDQPVQVGYSYGGKSINNSPDSARDVYAFLQLFYRKFPKYQELDFHISGESYAGTYLPNIAHTIHEYNQKPPVPSALPIPLKSVLIGNGLTDAYNQFPAYVDYACGDSPFAIFDEETCEDMARKVPACQTLTQYCYESGSRLACIPATLSCWQVPAPIQSSGLNPYDIRKTCDSEGEDGPLCYKEMGWIETFLNRDDIKKQLGAEPERTFESCNMQINQAFTLNGDATHNTVSLIPPLLESGIRFLIYVGEVDFICNFVGNRAWTEKLEWSGQAAYNKANLTDYFVGKSKKRAGQVKSVGNLFTYLQIHEAGHMVPFDQPEVSLDFFRKWINDEPLV